MGKPTVGSIVLVRFPHSDLRSYKIRPALVLAQVEFNDLLLCQITSKTYASTSAIELLSTDFSEGSLPIVSYIRPDKIFTADQKIVEKHIATISSQKLQQVQRSLEDILGL